MEFLCHVLQTMVVLANPAVNDEVFTVNDSHPVEETDSDDTSECCDSGISSPEASPSSGVLPCLQHDSTHAIPTYYKGKTRTLSCDTPSCNKYEDSGGDERFSSNPDFIPQQHFTSGIPCESDLTMDARVSAMPTRRPTQQFLRYEPLPEQRNEPLLVTPDVVKRSERSRHDLDQELMKVEQNDEYVKPAHYSQPSFTVNPASDITEKERRDRDVDECIRKLMQVNTSGKTQREQYYDAAVVYEKDDYANVVKFIQEIQAISFNQLREETRVELFDSEAFNKSQIAVVEDMFRKCSIIFVYISPNCCSRRFQYIVEETIGLARLNLSSGGYQHPLLMRRECAIIPVHTEPLTSRSYKTPIGLVTLKGLDWYDKNSAHTRAQVTQMMKGALLERKTKEDYLNPLPPSSPLLPTQMASFPAERLPAKKTVVGAVGTGNTWIPPRYTGSLVSEDAYSFESGYLERPVMSMPRNVQVPPLSDDDFYETPHFPPQFRHPNAVMPTNNDGFRHNLQAEQTNTMSSLDNRSLLLNQPKQTSRSYPIQDGPMETLRLNQGNVRLPGQHSPVPQTGVYQLNTDQISRDQAMSSIQRNNIYASTNTSTYKPLSPVVNEQIHVGNSSHQSIPFQSARIHRSESTPPDIQNGSISPRHNATSEPFATQSYMTHAHIPQQYDVHGNMYAVIGPNVLQLPVINKSSLRHDIRQGRISPSHPNMQSTTMVQNQRQHIPADIPSSFPTSPSIYAGTSNQQNGAAHAHSQSAEYRSADTFTPYTPASSELSVVSKVTGKLIVNDNLSTDDIEVDFHSRNKPDTPRKGKSKPAYSSSSSSSDSDCEGRKKRGRKSRNKTINIVGASIVQLGKHNTAQKIRTKKRQVEASQNDKSRKHGVTKDRKRTSKPRNTRDNTVEKSTTDDAEITISEDVMSANMSMNIMERQPAKQLQDKNIWKCDHDDHQFQANDLSWDQMSDLKEQAAVSDLRSKPADVTGTGEPKIHNLNDEPNAQGHMFWNNFDENESPTENVKEKDIDWKGESSSKADVKEMITDVPKMVAEIPEIHAEVSLDDETCQGVRFTNPLLIYVTQKIIPVSVDLEELD